MVHQDGSVNLNLVTEELHEDQHSNFDASPWGEHDDGASPTLSNKKGRLRRKKKKKVKRKIPKYPDEGYRLFSQQEFDDAYEALFWTDSLEEDQQPKPTDD